MTCPYGIFGNHNFNGAHQDGVGGYTLNIVDGIRQSTAIAYLTEEVRARPNLRIMGNATVDRVIFDGTRAVGVTTVGGTEYRAAETILSAGTYGSPAILMRSGIGPSVHLTGLGIDLVADLPVGENLRDHPMYATIHALTPEAAGRKPQMGALLWTASGRGPAGELDLHIAPMHPARLRSTPPDPR